MRIPVLTPRRRAAAGIALVLMGPILLGAGPPVARTASVTVNLGTAASFAVLAGDGVTDTGPSVISGDVGTHPRPAIPDLLDREATGSVDRAGARSRQAQQDLAGAYASVVALAPDGTVSLAGRQTLAPGVYDVTDAGQDLTASLTLDGQGAPSPVWIFVVASDLATAPGSTIALVNGAQACNVFWLVDGSATLASGSTFAGSILAMTSVTVGSRVTVDGRLLARTAAVSLGGDRITVPACTSGPANAAPQQPVDGMLAASSRTAGAAARPPSTLPGYLPIVMLVLLVAAGVLGEPQRGDRRRDRHRVHRARR